MLRCRWSYRSAFLLAALASLLLAACRGGAAKPGAAGFTLPPTSVETVVVARHGASDRFAALGTVEAVDTVTIVSERSGIIVELPVAEGEFVEQGQLLARLDESELRAMAGRAGALRDQAQVTYERSKLMVERGVSPPQTLDDARATLKVAEANLEVARVALRKVRITAPFAGVLGARRVSPGAYVSEGEAISELTRLSEVDVTFTAPERYLGALKLGTPLSVSTPALPGLTLESAVSFVDPRVDPRTRSVRLKARIANADSQFRPGMSADVSVVLGARPEALVVATEAVFAEGDALYVYVVGAESSVKKTRVTLGARTAAEVEVMTGLEADAIVVSAGHQKLIDGAKVAPIAASVGGPGQPGGPGGEVAR